MKKGAVIIETRNLPNLVEVIHDHMKYLPADWDIHIIGSLFNEHILNEFFKDKCEILSIASESITLSAYNEILTNKLFIDRIPFDKFLVFQHDSGILKTWNSNFEEYDYIGAPWKFQQHGGNGGLSWRSKEAMLAVIDKYEYNEAIDGNEDVYYSNNIEAVGYKLAPREVCSAFSCESIFALNTFGYHAINKWLSKEEVATILSQRGSSQLEDIYEVKCSNPSDINEHLPVLRAFASKCEHITEMGVRNVVSTYALMMGRPKTLVSYDINYTDAIIEAIGVADKEDIDFTYIVQDVLKVEIEPTDLLFIDTLHTYTQLSQELKLHASKVKKYIILHDTTTYGFKPEPSDWQTENIMENYVYNDKGLWPAVTEFLDSNRSWIVLEKRENNNGLTVLKRI